MIAQKNSPLGMKVNITSWNIIAYGLILWPGHQEHIEKNSALWNVLQRLEILKWTRTGEKTKVLDESARDSHSPKLGHWENQIGINFNGLIKTARSDFKYVQSVPENLNGYVQDLIEQTVSQSYIYTCTGAFLFMVLGNSLVNRYWKNISDTGFASHICARSATINSSYLCEKGKRVLPYYILKQLISRTGRM